MKGKVGGQWNKIFMEIFRSMSRGFLLLSPVSLTELCSFWYGLKDLFTLHKLVKKVPVDQDRDSIGDIDNHFVLKDDNILVGLGDVASIKCSLEQWEKPNRITCLNLCHHHKPQQLTYQLHRLEDHFANLHEQ